MLPLTISHDWATQIQSIRDATTDDTNLIRFDNGFYRLCRPGAETFQIHLMPGVDGAAGIQLDVRERDLYVTRIDGRPMETYAQTLDRFRPQAQSLGSAVMSLKKARGTDLFELQSLIVLCVAESLRNDYMATRIGQLIRATTTGLIGAPTRLPVGELLTEAHAWGQTSEAIFGALTAQARAIALMPRSRLTEAQRRFSERVDLACVEAPLQGFARGLKVIKRPG